VCDVLLERRRADVAQHLHDVLGHRLRRPHRLDHVPQGAAPRGEPDGARAARERGGEERRRRVPEVEGEPLVVVRDRVDHVRPGEAVGVPQRFLEIPVQLGGDGDDVAHDAELFGVRQQPRHPWLREAEALGDLRLAQAPCVVEPRHLRDQTQRVGLLHPAPQFRPVSRTIQKLLLITDSPQSLTAHLRASHHLSLN
jgi:hypothetical protein